MIRQPLGIAAMGLVTPLGSGPAEVAGTLFRGVRDGLVARDDLCPGRSVHVGEVAGDLPPSPPLAALHDCRNNRLMWAAVLQIRDAIDDAIRRHGPSRVGVILGTSTGGMHEQERARGQLTRTGDWPAGSHYRQWEVGAQNIHWVRIPLSASSATNSQTSWAMSSRLAS